VADGLRQRPVVPAKLAGGRDRVRDRVRARARARVRVGVWVRVRDTGEG
jgi:hypothetical protein